MIRRSLPLLAFALFATQAHANPLIDHLTQQLVDQGYQQIEVSRTFLGRVRIEATGNGGEREVIVNPRTGQILRDYWEDEEDEDLHAIEAGWDEDDDDDGPDDDGADEEDHDEDDHDEDDGDEDGDDDDDDDDE